MTQVFADSFVFFALLNPRDRRHASAVALIDTLRRPMLTTTWVLTEVADGLCARRTRALFTALDHRISSDSRITVIAPSDTLYSRGKVLYHSRSDKDWSLTDCISFVVMQDRNIRDALTADHHFEQAGFVALLK